MKNKVQDGDLMTVPAPADVESGDGVLVGLLFGVAEHDAASGADLVIDTEGVFTLPKTSAQAWTVGAAVYWDDSASVATTATTTDNVLIGVAAAVAANPSATGRVRLNSAAPAAAEA